MPAAAEAIAEILDVSGLSKSALSTRSGVSRALIDDYLAGRRQPAVRQLEKLGAAAGLRLDLAWVADASVRRVEAPSWARPNPDMRPPPLTIEQRAEVLARVVAMTTQQRRRRKGPLKFPPFKTFERS